MKWIKDPNKKFSDTWLELIEVFDDELDPDYHWTHAIVKNDGCIHFNKAGNVPYALEYGYSDQKRDYYACDDYIHICELDDFIESLINLRNEARRHFGKEWPE